MKTKHNSDVIEAAGGLVWRMGAAGKELAVIHRARYDDWTLPKGKLEKDESWESGAVREVWEETGCRAKLDDFAGSVSYLAGNQPKIVLFWHMHLLDEGEFKASDEVDQLLWLSLEEAAERVQYPGEKTLLKNLPSD